ncbi:hypothetical protein KIPB_013616, partial [Kipferlia bialata]|eukprot:g13616.t1
MSPHLIEEKEPVFQ